MAHGRSVPYCTGGIGTRNARLQDVPLTMQGLVLPGKFSEDHPIARGVSDRRGPHIV
jgi:hypothetical protein